MKVTGYQIQGIYSIFLLFIQSLSWRLLKPPLVFWLLKVLIGINSFLLTGIIFDMAQIFGLIFIFFNHLSHIDPSGGMASSTAFTMFVFLRSLGLRLTDSRWEIIGLSLIFVPILAFLMNIVLVFLGQQPIAFWALRVDLSSLKG